MVSVCCINQDAGVSCRQHFHGVGGKGFPADTSNGNKLCPSSGRHISLLIWSRTYSICSQPTGNSWISVQFHISIHRWCFVHKQPRVWELPGPDVSDWTWDQRHDREQHFCSLPGSVDWKGRSTSYFHSWQTWRFQIIHSWLAIYQLRPAYGVFISQLIRYARAWYSYGCFILRATRLSNELLEQGYVKERLQLSLKKFYGRYGDFIKHYEVPLSRMLNDIL